MKLTKQALWQVKGMTPQESHLYTWDLLSRHADNESGRKMMRDYRKKVEEKTGRPYVPGG